MATIAELGEVESVTEGSLVERWERELLPRDDSGGILCLFGIRIRLQFENVKLTVSPCGELTSQSAGKASDSLPRDIEIEAQHCGLPHDVCSSHG